MKAGPINIFLVCLSFLLSSSALPRAKDFRPLSSEYVPGEGSASANTLSKEPSCEELRAMWRFSKRQSRAAEITNEIPTYRDPFAYNVWEEYARPRSAGRGGRYRKPPIYGRVVHSATHLRPPEKSLPRTRVFEEVARIFGTPVHPVAGLPRMKTSFRLGGGGSAFQNVHPSQAGSFQHLKELIRTERARELQEQRLSEEAERNIGRVQYGQLPDSSELIQEKPSSNVFQGRGVVAFPDILIPSPKHLEEYAPHNSPLPAQKYKPRYPDSNALMGRNEWTW